ncbi:CPBP family intramembrane glutamic endopeptidase [Flindersiella endophytica]
MQISPEFSTVAIVLAIPLLAVLAIDPWFGKRLYQRLEQRRAYDSKALTGFFRRIIGAEWACAAVVVAIVALSPGSALSDFGLVLPSRALDVLPAEPSELAGTVVGLLVAGAILPFVFRRIAGSGLELWRAGLSTFEAMLPATRSERGYAVAVSVTAGICEELIYRGFLIAFGVGAFGLHPYFAGGIAVVLFGIAHFYQGWSGMIRVTVFGIAMTGLYLGTGSLFLPMLIHAAGDLVSLVVMPRLRQAKAGDGAVPAAAKAS